MCATARHLLRARMPRTRERTRREYLREWYRHDLPGGVAEKVANRGAYVGESEAEVCHPYHVRGVLGEESVARFAFLPGGRHLAMVDDQCRVPGECLDNGTVGHRGL